MIRTAWVGLHVIVSTFVIGVLVILFAAGGIRGGAYHWLARTWARWILLANGTRVRIEGLEHIALDRPQIVAANHVSWFDVLAIAVALPKRFRFVAKRELARIPIFGAAWKAAGHIEINRQDTQAAVASLNEAARIMREDKSIVVIFPEGTRSRGELLPFKKGAFMLALLSGVEIVPAAVIGSRHLLPRDSWRVHGGRITVRFAPPVQTGNFADDQRDRLIEAVRGEVSRLLAEQPDTPKS